jgi:hypothetical protein
MNIDIESQSIPAAALADRVFRIDGLTGGTASGMPSGSVYLYVFHVPLHGDCDGDGDVDLADFVYFQGCFTGPGGTYDDPACAPADADGDSDVDIADFVTIEPGVTGP